MNLQRATSQVLPRSIYNWWCLRVSSTKYKVKANEPFRRLGLHLNVILFINQWFLRELCVVREDCGFAVDCDRNCSNCSTVAVFLHDKRCCCSAVAIHSLENYWGAVAVSKFGVQMRFHLKMMPFRPWNCSIKNKMGF